MNFETLGLTAAQRLFAAIDGTPHSGLEALSTRVVIRGSTAPSS
jgi:LacI family transcriptional regulator